MMPIDGPGTGTASLHALAKEHGFDKRQIALLRQAGVRTDGELYSFLATDPLAVRYGGFDAPGLSERLAIKSEVMAMFTQPGTSEMRSFLGFGSMPPPEAVHGIGFVVPDLTPEEIEQLSDINAASEIEPPVPAHFPCGPWPVRNQENRGTCVAFAAAALYEYYLCRTNEESSDLSEQFLYWAIKHHRLDPYPNKDGSYFESALDALAKHGICSEADWPYDGRKLNPVSHQPAPNAAIQNAANRVYKSGTSGHAHTQNSGKAKIVKNLLTEFGAVGISLPTFVNPITKDNNWMTRETSAYGSVRNPGSAWVADGGHAVCCIGFVPDPEELNGGYFVIRNSWGYNFGQLLPHPDHFGPEVGYGSVSATYVDKYLWEYCVFN